MQFTGKNLELVTWALEGAISDVQMDIGSCPDVCDPVYIKRLDELEALKKQYERLLALIRKHNLDL